MGFRTLSEVLRMPLLDWLSPDATCRTGEHSRPERLLIASKLIYFISTMLQVW